MYDRKPLRALVCEDNGLIGLQLAKAVKRAGHEVIAQTADGSDCVALAQKYHPDIILMDSYLAGDLDGLATTRLITELQDVAVIVLTDLSDEEHRKRVLEAGACGFMVKPVMGEELLNAIEESLQRFHDKPVCQPS